MLILFLCELKAFLTPEVYSTVAIDSNQDSKVCCYNRKPNKRVSFTVFTANAHEAPLKQCLEPEPSAPKSAGVREA